MELSEVIQKYGIPDKSIVGKLPKGGIQLDFVGHADVTKMLIEIDPEWTWEPCGYTEDGLPAYRVENGMAHMAGWLTLCGVRRLGIGSVMHNKPDLLKELVSDFIRNAAMRFGVCLSLWTKQEWEDVAPSAPSKPAPVKDADPLVSKDNIERFKKACADAGLQVDQVAQNAGVDLNGLRESDMPALRASFKDLKEFASSPEPGFGSTDEAVAAVIDLFAGEEVQPSIDNHPAGGGKPQIKDPGGVPSPKQLGLIRSLGRGKELGNDDLIQAVSAFIGRDIAKLDDLTKGEASTAIEALQK
jgi:hypothetical protein